MSDDYPNEKWFVCSVRIKAESVDHVKDLLDSYPPPTEQFKIEEEKQ